MEVLEVCSVPMAEVSGISYGAGRVYAVSDSYAGVAWAPVVDGRPGGWEVVPGKRISGWRGGQLEAVSVLPDGCLILLSEYPGGGMLLDPSTWTVDRTAELVFPAGHELARAWRKDQNSRGEGLLALNPQAVLVAKEKQPTALVEFTLRGGELVAGRHWPGPPGLADISDLALAPGGKLALLSDQSNAVVLANWPFGERIVAGEPLRLPKSVVKAEGLTWLSDTVLAVACDTRKPKDNLFLLAWE